MNTTIKRFHTYRNGTEINKLAFHLPHVTIPLLFESKPNILGISGMVGRQLKN